MLTEGFLYARCRCYDGKAVTVPCAKAHNECFGRKAEAYCYNMWLSHYCDITCPNAADMLAKCCKKGGKCENAKKDKVFTCVSKMKYIHKIGLKEHPDRIVNFQQDSKENCNIDDSYFAWLERASRIIAFLKRKLHYKTVHDVHINIRNWLPNLDVSKFKL